MRTNTKMRVSLRLIQLKGSKVKVSKGLNLTKYSQGRRSLINRLKELRIIHSSQTSLLLSLTTLQIAHPFAEFQQE